MRSLALGTAFVLASGSIALAQEVDVDVRPDTTLVGEISDDRLPGPVQKTLDREANGGRVEEIDVTQEDRQLFFNCRAVIDGRKYQIVIAQNGTLLRKALQDEGEGHDVEVDDDAHVRREDVIREVKRRSEETVEEARNAEEQRRLELLRRLRDEGRLDEQRLEELQRKQLGLPEDASVTDEEAVQREAEAHRDDAERILEQKRAMVEELRRTVAELQERAAAAVTRDEIVANQERAKRDLQQHHVEREAELLERHRQQQRMHTEQISQQVDFAHNELFVAVQAVHQLAETLEPEAAIDQLRDLAQETDNPVVRRVIRQRLVELLVQRKDRDGAAEQLRALILDE